MEKKVYYTLILSLLCLFSTAQSKTEQYIINPAVLNFDSFPDLSRNIKLYVGTTEDSLVIKDTVAIGFTRTGRKTRAPIICSPNPALSVKKSLEALLSKKGVLTADPASATFIIQINILTFSLTESSKFLSQTMNAVVKLEVGLVDPLAADQIRRFVIEAQNSKSAMDTSKYSEEVIRGAIESAFKEILKSISRIPAGM